MQTTCMAIPIRRLSKEPELMFKNEAKPAPTNEPSVFPKLLIDMKSANRVPSIPGGHNCPDRIKNGMNLHSQGKIMPANYEKGWSGELAMLENSIKNSIEQQEQILVKCR